jgi:26S proteasome regulatory subunit N5
LEKEYRNEIVALLQGQAVEGGDDIETLWTCVKTRTVQRNIRTIAGYYSRISLAKLSKLVQLPPKETEQQLCDLILKGQVIGKIDRIAGTVEFGKVKRTEEVLNEWKVV